MEPIRPINQKLSNDFRIQIATRASCQANEKSIFGVLDIEGVRLLTSLRVQFSDLREHRFRHRFHCSNPTCLCQTGIEDNEHILLHCLRYTNYRKDLLDHVSNIVDIDLDSLTSTDPGRGGGT